jgi:hypothetical protein
MPVGGDEVSATPITLPGQEVPVGGDEVSATPITLPIDSDLGGIEEAMVLPVPIPGEGAPVGVDEVSVLPVPIPQPSVPVGADSGLDRAVDDEIALDRKGDDAPAGIGIDDASPDTEFLVEVIEEMHVEDVRLEEFETESVEWVEPVVDPEDLALDEGIDELDS